MDSFIVLSFVFGAIIGSFLNVVGLRLLREEEFVKRPSYCYSCEHRLSWLDMIPILSFILLRGKCRYCQAKVSFQYWAIELLTASVFALTYYYFGLTFQTLLLMYLFANLIVILITDFREQYIFDINSLGLIPFGLAFCALEGWSAHLGAAGGWTGVGSNLLQAAFAVGFSWAVFAILNLFSRLLFKADGFGEGDTRLLMGLGSFFGLKAVVVIFVASFVLQVVLALPMMFFQWIQKGRLKVVGLFTAAFVLGVLPYGLQRLEALSAFQLPIALVCAITALVLAFKAVKLSRESTDELTYIPFGPAICLAAGLFIFWSRSYMSG